MSQNAKSARKHFNSGFGAEFDRTRAHSSSAGDSSENANKNSDSSDLSASDQQMRSADGRILLNVNEVAELLGLSVGCIYHLVSQKRIPAVKLSSRCVRFRRSDIEHWISSLSQAAIP